MKFEDMNIGTQVGLSLEKYCHHHNLSLRECGVGSYAEVTERDAHRAWAIKSQTGKSYYIYLQVAYAFDQVALAKISKVSSIVLYDFASASRLAKTHLNTIADIKDFYPSIEKYIMDK